MFWDTTVPISEQMHETSGLIMHISRYLGCFPITVQKYKSKLFLKWSPSYALYSFVFGIVIITLTYDGFIADVLIGKEKSFRSKSKTDMLATFLDITAVVSVTVFGIFVTPFKFPTFCKYINCCNEIDSYVPPVNTKYSRYLPAFVTISVLFLILILQIADTLYYIQDNPDKIDLYLRMRCYAPFYLCYYVLLLSVCVFWLLVYCILKRIKLLNNCLKVENFIIPQITERNLCTAPAKIVDRNGNCPVEEIAKQDRKLDDNSRIVRLMMVYERICDAVDILNNLLGLNCAGMILGCLFQLIVTFYALIMELLGSRCDPLYVIMMIAWNCIHMGRLLFIVEPCYACSVEVQKTKDLICHLITSAEIDCHYKCQLVDFAKVLQLRKFEFTASGLASIDRMLIASVLGAITTYLVILLQVTDTAH